MKKIIVGLLTLVSSSPVMPIELEHLARALRVIALSEPAKKNPNPPVEEKEDLSVKFNLSEIDLADAASDGENTKLGIAIDNLAKGSLDPATITNYMATQYKANSKIFPLTQCGCLFFKRSSIDAASIRTSYEQLVIQKLMDGWTTRKEKEGKVAYISVGSGGLLTDFSIADQFLDKVPNADLTIEAVDTEYKHYLQLLDFCEGEPFLTKESIEDSLFEKKSGWHGDIQLGWSLNNAKSTKDFAAKHDKSPEDKKSIIKNLIIPHEQFQRFLYLLTKRHPKATVKLELWSSMEGPTNAIKRIAPDFIGSIDALDQKSPSIYELIDAPQLDPKELAPHDSEVVGPIFPDFKSLCDACITQVRKTCDNLVVGRYNTNDAVLLGRFIHKDYFDPKTTTWDYAWWEPHEKLKPWQKVELGIKMRQVSQAPDEVWGEKPPGDIITLLKEIWWLNYGFEEKTMQMIDALK